MSQDECPEHGIDTGMPYIEQGVMRCGKRGGCGLEMVEVEYVRVVNGDEGTSHYQPYCGRFSSDVTLACVPLTDHLRAVDLIRRLLPGWGSDEHGCDSANYAAYEEAVALVSNEGQST